MKCVFGYKIGVLRERVIIVEVRMYVEGDVNVLQLPEGRGFYHKT
jgi:hypothetical protein